MVVVTWQPGESLDRFLDSLGAATAGPAPSVLLADNGSTDGSVERAAMRPGVTLLRTGANLGYGGAANVGIGHGDSPGELVVIANPDIVWHPGALDELVAGAQRWPRAGALGPAIITMSGDLYPSARSFPSLSRGIGHALLGWWWPSNRFTQSYRRERRDPVEATAGWLSGSCLLLRRAAFDEVGGFDPAYFMYFEDLELCRRLSRAGWQNVYVPSAVVTHEGGAATRQARSAMLRAHHRSAYRYIAAEYAGARWLPVRLVLGAGLISRYLLSLVLRPVREGARPTRSASALQGDVRSSREVS
ncbi:MAG TPA: glycosyltransferase family 2 protein [Mycobacteriales bacterium]|nr:glycosyltransferase family 2 protein [Mycobacteriales bacterium]